MRLRLRTPLLLLSLLASASAAAQTTTDVSYVKLTMGTGFNAAFNQDFCLNETMSVSYEVTALVAGMKLAVFVTEGSCPDTPSATDKALMAESTVTTGNQAGTLQFAASKLVPEPLCPANTTKDFVVCAVVKAPNYSTYGTTTTDQVLGKSSLALQYDSVQPKAPVVSAVTGGDSKLFLEWDTQEGIDVWTVYYRKTAKGPSPDAGDEICVTTSAGGGTGGADPCVPETDKGFCDRLAKVCGEVQAFDNCEASRKVNCGGCASSETCRDGLCVNAPDAGVVGADAGAVGDAGLSTDAGPVTPAFDSTGWASSFAFEDGAAVSGELRELVNNQEYELVLVAKDNAGNVSPGSAIRVGTPFVVQDFYRRYRCAGGTETGGFGCSTAGMMAIPGAAIAMLALLRRRRGA